MSFIKHMILPQTNNNLPVGKKNVLYGEFLRWLGFWMLMGTLIGTQRHEVWATHTINVFHGVSPCLGIWISSKHFDAILSALSFTDAIPPTYLYKFWEIRQMVEAWGGGGGFNMMENFVPWDVNCVDKSTGQTTSHALGSCSSPINNGHLATSTIPSVAVMGIDLVEGKDHPRALGQQEFHNMGSTVGLLLRMLASIFHKGYVVILDSDFCVLKAIIEVRKKGVFASALIKK